MPRITNLQTLSSGNSFAFIQPPSGGTVAADSPSDTLTFTSSNGSVTIVGNPATDTIDFTAASGSGDVVGPASSTDNAVVLWDGLTGKLIKNSTILYAPATTFLSGIKLLPAQICTSASGSEGRIPFFNNTNSNTNGLGTDSGFLYNSTKLGVRLGPSLTEVFDVFNIEFLSRFWALSQSGFLATFVLEHRAGGAGEVPIMICAKSNGTVGSRSDVINGDGLGAIYWVGFNSGTTYATAANVSAQVDGTPGFFSVPGSFLINVTATGAFTPSETAKFYSDRSIIFQGGLVVNEQGLDQDTRIEGDTNANLFYVDAGNDRVGIRTNAPTDPLHVNGSTSLDGAVVINEGGAAVNFRVESDTQANLIFTDGTNNRVGIGTASPTTLFHVNGASNLDGQTILNESGADVDCRIEGDNDANLLYTDASTDQIIFGASSAATGVKAQTHGVHAVKMGAVSTTTDVAKVGGVISVNLAPVGNVGTGEDNLMTYTLPASALGTTNDFIEINGFGSLAANANTKRVRVYFGATVILDTTALALNSGNWQFTARVYRTGAATQYAEADWSKTVAGAAILVQNTNPAETLSGTVLVRVTGEGVANNDIVQNSMTIRWFPAP